MTCAPAVSNPAVSYLGVGRAGTGGGTRNESGGRLQGGQHQHQHQHQKQQPQQQQQQHQQQQQQYQQHRQKQQYKPTESTKLVHRAHNNTGSLCPLDLCCCLTSNPVVYRSTLPPYNCQRSTLRTLTGGAPGYRLQKRGPHRPDVQMHKSDETHHRLRHRAYATCAQSKAEEISLEGGVGPKRYVCTPQHITLGGVTAY